MNKTDNRKPLEPNWTLEAACIRLLGRARWETTETLSPSQVMEGVAMLQEGLAVEITAEAVRILLRWEWFRQAGLASKPPWEIVASDWETLARIAPWAERQEQLELF